MMNLEEIKCNIDHLLADRGLTKEYKEQAVRLLLYHLYIAIDIYRYMSFSEKNIAGYWYRTFKSTYSMTGFLKERKRNREKEKFPPHPLNKEKETEVKEKEQKTLSLKKEKKEKREKELRERQVAFWNECKQFISKHGEDTVVKFYCYWAEEVKGTGMMLWELETKWTLWLRIKGWAKNPLKSKLRQQDCIRNAKRKRWQSRLRTPPSSRPLPQSERLTMRSWSRKSRSAKPVPCRTKSIAR